MRFLVSGVAGDIGLGIGRIIKYWGIAKKVYGIDIRKNHPGEFVFDKCYKAPHAENKNYFEWITEFFKKKSIDLFIPTSESEISMISRLGVNKFKNIKILINNKFTVDNCLDKYKCLTFLEKKGIQVPKYGLIENKAPDNFPFIVKPRFGQGSKGVRVISNKKELDLCQSGLVWQELLVPNNEEYTCPIYFNKNKNIRILLIKRELKGGMTYSGLVVKNKKIESYVKKIASVMKVKGSINIQLRLTKQGPLLFEINPRLSGTIVFRDKIGFEDLKWWIADTLGITTKKYALPKDGVRFYRGYTEYIKEV
ncbi:ATP-grasp domain-containing protein [Alphaproteobacteria bacterium]|nr:ATP-grasp domain-containing protein [Alphaproteobacteria bacterium]